MFTKVDLEVQIFMGQKYNVIKSPYIELGTPFTAWYVVMLLCMMQL